MKRHLRSFGMGASLWLALASPSLAAEAPLTLHEVVGLARDRHLSVKASRHMLQAAEAQKSEAFSRYLPSLGLETGPSYSHLPGANLAAIPGVGGMVGFPSSGTVIDTTLSLRQVVFDGFATSDAVRLAELGVDISREQLKASEQETMQNAALAYFQVLRAEGLRRVATETLAQDEEHLHQGEARFAAGNTTRMDVLQLKAIVANARVALKQAQNAVEIARLGLAHAIAQPVADRPLAAPQGLSVRLQESASAIRQRPDFRQAELRVTQSETRSALESRGLWPTISATSRYSQRDANQGIVSAGVTVGWSFLDSSRVLRRMEASQNEAEASRLQLQLTSQVIELELQQGLKRRDEALGRAEALKEGLAAAQEAYRLAKERFVAGLATNVELRDVQTTLVQTENSLLQAETDWREAEVRLARAMGVDLAGFLAQ